MQQCTTIPTESMKHAGNLSNVNMALLGACSVPAALHHRERLCCAGQIGGNDAAPSRLLWESALCLLRVAPGLRVPPGLGFLETCVQGWPSRGAAGSGFGRVQYYRLQNKGGTYVMLSSCRAGDAQRDIFFLRLKLMSRRAPALTLPCRRELPSAWLLPVHHHAASHYSALN